MARPNNRGTHTRPSWIQRQRSQYGQYWYKKLRGDELQKGAIFIFRDLARNNYNPELDGECFLDYQFFNLVLGSAYTKFKYYEVLLAGLNTLIGSGAVIDPCQDVVYTDISKRYSAYKIIYDNLVAFGQNKDLRYISVIISQLVQGRYSQNI